MEDETIKNKLEEIIKIINNYLTLNNKLEENNKLYSSEIFKNWINNEKNKSNKEKFLKEASQLIKNLDVLKNTIKFKIDKLYYDEKLNFIEIEKAFRDKNISAYLIAQPKEPELKGSKTVNSDDEPVEFTTSLLITDDQEVLKHYLNVENESEEIFKKRVDINLSLLIKSGIVVVDKEEEVKEDLKEKYLIYNKNNEELNDY
uniref:Uncharacterized protein n=1 Tax=viral metagenome TaxID=1070528 RepID=A0A6C0ACP2_9ZZZZ